jgi:hypothetical protein
LHGPLTIFADSGGLFQLNSDGSIAPVGFEKIDGTVFSRISGANLSGIYARWIRSSTATTSR